MRTTGPETVGELIELLKNRDPEEGLEIYGGTRDSDNAQWTIYLYKVARR